MTLTLEQFNKLVTKDEFNERIQKMEEKMVTKDDFHDVADKLMKKLDNVEHAFVSNQAAHDRFEKRLTRLEKHLELNPLFDY